MPTTEIESQLSTTDLVRLDADVQLIKCYVKDALHIGYKTGTHTDDISENLKTLKTDTNNFGVPELYRYTLSLVNGYYLNDLSKLENKLFDEVNKRPNVPTGSTLL